MRLLKKVFSQIKEDINTIYEKDPAAENILEVLFCYPGLHALHTFVEVIPVNLHETPFGKRRQSLIGLARQIGNDSHDEG